MRRFKHTPKELREMASGIENTLAPADSLPDNAPVIERIDLSRGYYPGNIRWISNKARKIRGDTIPVRVRPLLQGLAEAMRRKAGAQ
jgi:hypothetical protein